LLPEFKFMQELIIGLGSNLGDRRENLEKAIKRISEMIGRVTTVSTFVETEPWGFESKNAFLNGVAIVEDTSGSSDGNPKSAMEVIRILQSIETDFGRIRTGAYTDREIDLDILFYGDEIINERELVVPHPKLHEREFVLVSLMEICPDKIHPVFGKSIREIRNALLRR